MRTPQCEFDSTEAEGKRTVDGEDARDVVGRAHSEGRIGWRSGGDARKHEIGGPSEDGEARVLTEAASESDGPSTPAHRPPHLEPREIPRCRVVLPRAHSDVACDVLLQAVLVLAVAAALRSLGRQGDLTRSATPRAPTHLQQPNAFPR